MKQTQPGRKLRALKATLANLHIPNSEKQRVLENVLNACVKTMRNNHPSLSESELYMKAEQWLRDKLR